jgi:hypothetical protein
MKKILSLLILFAFSNINAQFWKNDISGNGNVVNRTRSIGNFDQILITGSFEVSLVKGYSGKIELITDENLLQVIETYVSKHKLYIKINSKFNLKRYTKLSITLPVDDVEGISISGSARVKSTSTFDWSTIKLNVLGSGSIDLSLHSSIIKAFVTGSGNIILQGKSDKVSCKVTGSGSIIGRELISNKAEIAVTGSGDIYIKSPVDKLKASVTGSGNIYYYGTPETITSKTLGSGSIIQK